MPPSIIINIHLLQNLLQLVFLFPSQASWVLDLDTDNEVSSVRRFL